MISINGIDIGKGIPKICVPIVEAEAEAVIREAERISKSNCHIVEWRVDFYEGVFDRDKLIDTLKNVKMSVGEEKILLFTFRTKSEGGQKDIEKAAYRELLKTAIDSGFIHIVDVELSAGKKFFEEIVAYADRNKVYVLGSNHDFDKTPSSEEMVDRLVQMKNYGAHISKIAVMPKSTADVAELLKATGVMKDRYSEITTVTMSMGKLGAISRIAGEIFGSAITFGILDKPSAPGQVKLDKLERMMKEINEL